MGSDPARAACEGCNEVAAYARTHAMVGVRLQCSQCGASVLLSKLHRIRVTNTPKLDELRAYRTAEYRTVQDMGCIARYRAWRDRSADRGLVTGDDRDPRALPTAPWWFQPATNDAASAPVDDGHTERDHHRAKELEGRLHRLASDPTNTVPVAVLEHLVSHVGIERTKSTSVAHVIGQAFASADALAVWTAARDLDCMSAAHGGMLLRSAVSLWTDRECEIPIS